MFEDDENIEISFDNHCSFCGKKIKFMPLSSVDKKLKFCDLVCAKLYYDNKEHFAINRIEYNNYYINDQLSKKAKEVFGRVGSILFKQLPIYKPLPTDVAYNCPELMKKKYSKILTPSLYA